jgi:hypothetical protein
MAWGSKSVLKNTALTTTQSDISEIFINRGATHMVVYVETTTTLTGDIYLLDSSSSAGTFSQVATSAYDGATSLVWRLDLRTTPLRDVCKIQMKLDASTGTVSTLIVTYEK